MSTAFPVTADPRYRLYVASSNQTVFSIAFPFLEDGDISVTKIGLDGTATALTRPTHYTQTGKGNPLGGSITLKTGVSAGTKILVKGAASLTRSTSVARAGKFSSAAIDEDLDRLTIIAQEHARDIERSVKVPEGDVAPTLTPGAAGTLAVWDDNGDLAEGPSAAGLTAVDVALGVDAGRALVYPDSGAEIYDAGGRKIGNVADADDPQQVVTKAQLDAAIAAIDLTGIAALQEALDAIEARVDVNAQTGDLKIRVSSAAIDGWLLVNGQTIGDELSGGTARANADTEALFTLLWNGFSNTLLPIQNSDGSAGTRGADAATDLAAHKRMPLPDARGEFLRFLDLSRGIDSLRALGSAQADLVKNHTHPASTANAGAHDHDINTRDDADLPAGGRVANTTGTGDVVPLATSSAPSHSHAVTVSNNTGGGAENRPRNIAFPLFVKL